MSTDPSASIAERPSAERTRLGLLRGYWDLARPRIVGMVLFTMLVAALVAGPRVPPWDSVLHAVLGVGLAIAGAIALNQRLERSGDARMTRTALRPVPSGRLTLRQATAFGIGASAAGLVYLGLLADWPVLLLAAASWAVYICLYTPMKMFTAWQTPIGAVAGAMPALVGAAAAGAPASPTGLALFGVVYFWQFPHAMAIAWLYRDQFRRADVKVATVVDASGRTAGRLAVLGAICLLPVSLVPSLFGPAGWGYGACALLLGLGYLACSARLLRRPDDGSARLLLRGSFVYLPVVLIALVVTSPW